MKRLLVVDDEPAICRLIQRVAEGCGYAVTVTHNPNEFMGELAAEETDAIILDLSLPDVDGVELLRFLAASNCRVPILIMSGLDRRVLETTGRLGEARGLNIAGTLTKPVRVEHLRAAIAHLHEAAVQ